MFSAAFTVTFVQNVIMLIVTKLIAIMPSVVAPFFTLKLKVVSA
jgi:hypothetical protein